MGWYGWMESHPFTIASVSNTGDGLVLMIKQTGSWTTRLYDMAKASGYGESGKKTVKKVKVMVDGPYGTVLHFRIVNAGFDTIWD
jgi:predicted ferric reductase